MVLNPIPGHDVHDKNRVFGKNVIKETKLKGENRRKLSTSVVGYMKTNTINGNYWLDIYTQNPVSSQSL